MQIIVPLAGPDFVREDGSVKALVEVDGQPLLLKTLRERSWFGRVPSSNYTFILHDRAETRAFANSHLSAWFEGCRIVFISDFTRGAALSALAGVSIQADLDAPVICDLADIAYQSDLDIERVFEGNMQAGAIFLTFASDNPVYSYLRRDDSEQVVEAAEKRVISNEASAGTYIFRKASVYLRAVAHALDNAETQTYRNLFFVCPLANGVIDQNLQVEAFAVTDVVDIKTF